MKIFAAVKAGAKKNFVKKIDDSHYAVAVKARPHEGMANEAVILSLAEHFDVPKTSVRIVSGRSSRVKRVEIII